MRKLEGEGKEEGSGLGDFYSFIRSGFAGRSGVRRTDDTPCDRASACLGKRKKPIERITT